MICRDRPRDVAVLSGDDAATLAILAMGGDGVVSVASNEIPAEWRRCARRPWAAVWDEARRIHERWLPLMRANFQGAPSPVPVKAAMASMGILSTDTLRAPMLPLDEAPGLDSETLLRDLALVDGGGRFTGLAASAVTGAAASSTGRATRTSAEAVA